ncbi:MAG: hypothetical protein LBQ27_00940 [Clostridiales bacterium]|jgi:hypothetical protein|nr:hypothetical protein [Clostridiales bacterium]
MGTPTRNTIQSLAVEAKKRLKLGYWNEIKEKRRLDETDGCAVRRYRDRQALTKEEEFYYGKVKKILSESADGVIINPIGRLMDEKYFSELSFEDKQYYVFKLSGLYISIKNKILREESEPPEIKR